MFAEYVLRDSLFLPKRLTFASQSDDMLTPVIKTLYAVSY